MTRKVNASLGLSTWQEVMNFLLESQCIQQTSLSQVSCKMRHMCSK